MTTFASHITKGTHAARLAATAVPSGSLYSCSDHALIYQSDGATWSTYATLGGGGLKDFAQAERATTDITVNSATFTNVDTALDLVMTAASGDVIEVGMAASVKGGSTAYAVFDFVTVVGGSPVNSITSASAAGTGMASAFPAWGRARTQVALDVEGGSTIVGTKRYVVQSGDISSGTVTLRLRVFCGASITIAAGSATNRLYVHATNLGPQL